VVQWLPIGPRPQPAPQPPPESVPAPGGVAPGLPPPEQFHTLDDQERKALTDKLRNLAGQLHVEAPAAASAEDLLDRIDRHLGTPDPQRNPGALAEQGPVQRRLRVLLWKHDVPEYRERGLNPVELVERLETKLKQEKKL
jgi:hypothetical protein